MLLSQTLRGGSCRYNIYCALAADAPSKFCPTWLADPVHFWPDPDPENHNFKAGSGSCLQSSRINSSMYIFFISIRFLQIFVLIFLGTYKNRKIHLKMFLKFCPCLFIQLYIAREGTRSGSCEIFPEPAKKVKKGKKNFRIRPDPESCLN